MPPFFNHIEYTYCMRRLSLLIIIAVVAIASIAAVDAYIIPLSSDFYDIIDDLYALEGLGSPSDARPYSIAQAEMILSKVPTDSISGYSKTLHEKANEILNENVRWKFKDGFGIGAHLEVNPEIYVHSNSEDFTGEEDWAYQYDDRERFLYLGLEFSVYDFFYTYADLMYTMGRYNKGAELISNESSSLIEDGIGAILPPSGETPKYWIAISSPQYTDLFSTNIPPQSAKFEFVWPKRAFVSFGGKHWTLQFGRERLDWGNSRASNFIIDSHVGYHDTLRLTFFTDSFSYEWSNLFFDTQQEGSEVPDKSIRMLMAHRLEFRPIKYISFAISENVMYQTPALNIGAMNPGNIFHNLNNRGMFNAIASAELNVMPIKGLDIYAQAVLDQARAPNEDDSQSDSWGILGGAEYSFSPRNTGVLSFNLEFDYTSPLLYRRDGVDFLMYRRSMTMNLKDNEGQPLKLYYIGYKYGGDVALLHLGISYDLYDVFSVFFTGDFMLKGEMDMAHTHNKDGKGNDGNANYAGVTPSGNVISQIMILTLGGEYHIPGLPDWMGLSFSSALSLVGAQNWNKTTKTASDGRMDVQFSLAMKLSI